MKQYVYKPSDIGIEEWPSGQLRLDGIDITEYPQAADIFVYPGPLFMFNTVEELDKLPFIKGNETRHIFFDCSDNKTYFTGKSCIFLRCNLMDELLAADPNSVSIAWPVEDFKECIYPPAGGFKYHVSFHGWLSTATREISSNVCKNSKILDADIAQYKDFCGYIYAEPEGIRRRAEFRRSMKESRVALCPESIPGVFPYRFFEAMSAGRIPVLVGSDYNLPFAEEIPYDEFCLFYDRDDAHYTDAFLEGFLEHTNDEEIIRRGLIGRHYWERYLNREKWPQIMAYAVKKKLKELRLFDGEVGTL